jgi:hypothetical protein
MSLRKTNELKKGTMIQLANGWKAQLWDNMRGNTRMAEVYGDFTEIGSVYSHDIMWWQNPDNDKWSRVTHTKAQLGLKETVESWEDTRTF